MSSDNDDAVGCFAVLGVAQFVTYAMAAIRWFDTAHYSFWHGFKELLWATFPVINFTYVWDWWAAIFQFVFTIGKALFELALNFVGRYPGASIVVVALIVVGLFVRAAIQDRRDEQARRRHVERAVAEWGEDGRRAEEVERARDRKG